MTIQEISHVLQADREATLRSSAKGIRKAAMMEGRQGIALSSLEEETMALHASGPQVTTNPISVALELGRKKNLRMNLEEVVVH